MGKSKTLIITVPLMLLMAVFVTYQYGFVRIKSDMDSVREEEASKSKILEKTLALIAERPDLEKKIVSLREEIQADKSKLIEGQTPSLSAAALQEMVKGIILGRGGSISSERVGKPEDHGKFKVISVSLDAVMPDIRALVDVLYSIESRTPYLVIKDLDIRVRNFREAKDLMVKLDVSALGAGK